MFVQFPHPGAEHRANGAEMPWNRGAHARKFLKADGQYLRHGNIQSGSLTFWGEWEPQSRVIAEYRDGRSGWPHRLHEPFWRLPADDGWRQNTDPLVFGEHFLYSNCRQQQNGKLRELAPGSLVLFGSKLAGEFVLDTMFVVGDDDNRSSASSPELGADVAWIHHIVLEPIRLAGKQPAGGFRLYRGRTHMEAPNGPYSFVPCRPCRPPAGFARPAIRLERRWIEPNLAMNAKATPATLQELRALWLLIVEQVVVRDGLALGIRLDVPPRIGGAESDKVAGMTGCGAGTLVAPAPLTAVSSPHGNDDRPLARRP